VAVAGLVLALWSFSLATIVVAEESARSNSERSNSERSNSERSNSERSNSERSNSERSNSERSTADKSNADKPGGADSAAPPDEKVAGKPAGQNRDEPFRPGRK